MDGAKQVHVPRLCPRPFKLQPWSPLQKTLVLLWPQPFLSSSHACPALKLPTKANFYRTAPGYFKLAFYLRNKNKLRDKENRALVLFKKSTTMRFFVPNFSGRVSNHFSFRFSFRCHLLSLRPSWRGCFPPTLYKTGHVSYSLNTRENCHSCISVILYSNC